MVAPLLLSLLRGPSPKATVEAFVRALNAGDARAMVAQLAGKPKSEFGSASDLRGAAKVQATVGKVAVTGDEATAEIDLRIVGEDGTLASHESARLRRIAGDWRLVPTPLTDPTVPTLSMIASVLVDPPVPDPVAKPVEPKASPAAPQSLANARRLALATLMYAADHGDALPQASAFKTAVAPYVRDPAIFTAPGGPAGSVGYFLDPRLSGVRLGSLGRPAETALIVEGADGKAVFPYGGRGAVAYADGRAKLIDATETAKARAVPLDPAP